jgi:hypothetical protein
MDRDSTQPTIHVRIRKRLPPDPQTCGGPVGWLESFAPESYSERQLEELDRLTEEWIDNYERKSAATRK